MPQPFRSDRTWAFGVGSGQLWERIAAVDEYTTWWPWLTDFDPGRGFAEGERWRCEVRPPLPYVVRFTILIDRVEAPVCVQATVSGDIGGEALLVVTSEGSGSRARLRSSLHPAHPLLRGVAGMARPLVGWGHDWVLDQGRRQFVDRAI